MWKYFVNPCINNNPWTDEEEDKLRELVEEYEGLHWDLIAEELGVCFKKKLYRTCLTDSVS